uniref:Uncharacterized protein n=1 Tax=Lotharella globosa TaxID=91324 RepID=A0A7S4DM06_9EUKA
MDDINRVLEALWLIGDTIVDMRPMGWFSLSVSACCRRRYCLCRRREPRCREESDLRWAATGRGELRRSETVSEPDLDLLREPRRTTQLERRFGRPRVIAKRKNLVRIINENEVRMTAV